MSFLDRLLDGNKPFECEKTLSLLPVLLEQGVFSSDQTKNLTQKLIGELKNGNCNPRFGQLLGALGKVTTEGENFWENIVNVLLNTEPLPLSLIESMECGNSLVIRRLMKIMFCKENTAQEEQKLAGTIKRLISRGGDSLSPTDKIEICELINQMDFSEQANPPLILNSLFHSLGEFYLESKVMTVTLQALISCHSGVRKTAQNLMFKIVQDKSIINLWQLEKSIEDFKRTILLCQLLEENQQHIVLQSVRQFEWLFFDSKNINQSECRYKTKLRNIVIQRCFRHENKKVIQYFSQLILSKLYLNDENDDDIKLLVDIIVPISTNQYLYRASEKCPAKSALEKFTFKNCHLVHKFFEALSSQSMSGNYFHILMPLKCHSETSCSPTLLVFTITIRLEGRTFLSGIWMGI